MDSTKQYLDNIGDVYSSLNGKELEMIDATPVVPASMTLKDGGNNLYVENGVLKCQPAGYSASLNRYLENNGLVNSQASASVEASFAPVTSFEM